jgi:hypothetical protein
MDTENTPPDFILAGIGKSATTWIYNCLKDHPEVYVPTETDSVNYFDINYHRGVEWYDDHFSECNGEEVIGEATPSYLIDEKAAERVSEDIPGVKLIFCLRNPVDRAFSHWWHGKSQSYWSYDFEEIFDSYPPYQMWVTPGFYDHHLSKFDEYFDEIQMEIKFFDDLVEDDKSFIQDIYSDISVDDSYVPKHAGSKVNEAALSGPEMLNRTKRFVEENAPPTIVEGIRPAWENVKGIVEDRNEYEEGMDEDIRENLEEVFVDDVRNLSERVDRDLSDWFRYVEV